MLPDQHPATGVAASNSRAAVDIARCGQRRGEPGRAGVGAGWAGRVRHPRRQTIIVAQPAAGQAIAFSAICTHMGCTVAPNGGELDCPCHGSRYNALTGQVIQGPAPQALPKIAVSVQNGEVVTG